MNGVLADIVRGSPHDNTYYIPDAAICDSECMPKSEVLINAGDS